MKSNQLAATLLTALAATPVYADMMPVYQSKTVCIPTYVHNGKAEIVTLCDASQANRNLNLTLNDEGCATSGQRLQGSTVFDQSAVTIWGTTDEEIASQSLQMCDDYSIAPLVLEL